MSGAPKLTLGVIGGSGLLRSALLRSVAKEQRVVETAHGAVHLYQGALSDKVDVVMCMRHGCDPAREYSLPHLVNYRAMLCALQQLGCCAVVGICSVGSMKTHIGLGSVVVPDDFFCPAQILSAHEDKRAHGVPGLSARLREELLSVLDRAGLRPVDGGVYLNSLGPRFETKAEIRWMAQCGDLVGMTGAHEAELARELGLHYAMLCLVDNMANGVGEKLTLPEFFAAQERNRPRAELAVQVLLQHFRSYPEILAALRELPCDAPLAAPALAPGGAPGGAPRADLVVHVKYVVTVDAGDRVLERHAVVVRGGRIVEMLPSDAADTKYGVLAGAGAGEVQRFPGGCLMPGLINAHTHASMTLLRGFGDDMAVDRWLSTRIWPAEVRAVSRQFVLDGARLACAEFIKGGTTCFNDMYFFPEAVAEAVEESGMRCTVGAIAIEFPSNYGSGPDEYLAKGRALLDRLRAADGPGAALSPRVRCAVAPHSAYAVSDQHLAELAEMAREYDVPLHIHVHESAREVLDSELGDRSSQFCHMSAEQGRPLANLLDKGIVSERAICAHMVHLTEGEERAVAACGASVVHCPTSNLKLASGFCQVARLLKAGVNVAIGTDGAASNNSLDMFQEMKLAAVLAKGVAGDPEAVPASAALRMATINGAKALRIDKHVGSLEAGKEADMIVVDIDDISSMPTYSVVSHLVYATGRSQVTDVWVQGRQVLRAGQLVAIDCAEVRVAADRWQETLRALEHDGTYK